VLMFCRDVDLYSLNSGLICSSFAFPSAPPINGGMGVTTDFGHGAVLSVADKVVAAVKSGDIKHLFLVGGCDGAKTGRNYYTDFVKQTPSDTVILTLAYGKYRFNDLDLRTIGGLHE